MSESTVDDLCTDFDDDISLDEIVPRLFLGNLGAATNIEILKQYSITHILTLDTEPLPKHIRESSSFFTKYVEICDIPEADILHELEPCVAFIQESLGSESSAVLVHCYFGMSRSSSVVIAYMMKVYDLDYEAAFQQVKSKRSCVQPNSGFESQLKLYKEMFCKIDVENQKYKMYRLRLVAAKVRQLKILPQKFHDIIKPDPGSSTVCLESSFYRCRKCLRVLALKSHEMTHNNLNKNKNNENQCTEEKLLGSLSEICKEKTFIEPIAWMENITKNSHGQLLCPKCLQKIGNFSWIDNIKCPCGKEVTPAFYLINSKTELIKTRGDT